MKKLAVIALIVLSIFTLGGCKNKNVEGSLEDIMTKLYDGIKEDNLPMMIENMEINKENVEQFLGTKDIKFKEAIASESMTGSVAHSVVLLRTEKNANVEDVKKAIKENINPRKWICVGVEKKDVIIKSKGDLVMALLIEDKSNREAIDKNFDNL